MREERERQLRQAHKGDALLRSARCLLVQRTTLP